jgi:hypothetical protein
VAIAALVVWICTAAIGGYLLATSTRGAEAADAPEEAPVEVPARGRDRFDPPSLVRAKSEPLPGMRALGEFAHPALAVIGLGFWLGYVLSRDRMFAVIGLGVLLGALCAGISWALANARAARRAAAGHRPGRPGALLFTPRLLILHGLGAALTLLLTALIAARA